MDQITWTQTLSHADQIYKLAEEEHASSNGVAVVLLYDELLRRSISNRAEWGDASLNLDEVVQERYKQILDAARQRLAHAGMMNSKAVEAKPAWGTIWQSGSSHEKANLTALDGATEERMFHKTQEALKHLAKQQMNMEATMNAMSQSTGFGKGGKGGEKLNRRQQKSEAHYEQMLKDKQFKGGGRGKHGKGGRANSYSSGCGGWRS